MKSCLIGSVLAVLALGGHFTLRLRALAGDDRLALARGSFTSETELGGWNDQGDEFDTYVNATAGPQTVVVTHSPSGLSASVEIPAAP